MDNSEKLIQFVTINNRKAVHNKNSRRFRKNPIIEYGWGLSKAEVRKRDAKEIQKELEEERLHTGPAEQVLDTTVSGSAIMTVELALEVLNNRDCFCFEYIPWEGDILSIQVGRGFLLFAYMENEWKNIQRSEYIFENMSAINNGVIQLSY